MQENGKRPSGKGKYFLDEWQGWGKNICWELFRVLLLYRGMKIGIERISIVKSRSKELFFATHNSLFHMWLKRKIKQEIWTSNTQSTPHPQPKIVLGPSRAGVWRGISHWDLQKRQNPSRSLLGCAQDVIQIYLYTCYNLKICFQGGVGLCRSPMCLGQAGQGSGQSCVPSVPSFGGVWAEHRFHWWGSWQEILPRSGVASPSLWFDLLTALPRCCLSSNEII